MKTLTKLTSSILLIASMAFAGDPILIGPGVQTINNADGDITLIPGSNISLNTDTNTGKIKINATVPQQVQSDWNVTDSSKPAFIKNKPTIPAAQVNSDWNATEGVAKILNKPDIPTVNNATLTIQTNSQTVGTFTANAANPSTINITIPTPPTVNDATLTIQTNSVNVGTFTANSAMPTTINIKIPADQVNADWDASSGVAQILNKPDIPTVNDATLTIQTNNVDAGSFSANASSPTTIKLDIPSPQVNSDWNASSGVAEILNKPNIPSVTNFVEKTGDTMTGLLTIDEDNLYVKASQIGHGNIRADGGLLVGYPLRAEDPFDTQLLGKWAFFSGLMGWAQGEGSVALGRYILGNDQYSFTWSGEDPEDYGNPDYYESHGEGSFNANPLGGITNFWIGETNLLDHVVDNTKDRYINLAEDRNSQRTAATVGLRDTNFVVGAYSVSIGNGTMQSGSQYEIASGDSISVSAKDENRALNSSFNYTLSSSDTINGNLFTLNTASGTGFIVGEPLVIKKSGNNTEIDGVVLTVESGALKSFESKVRPMGAVGDNSLAVGEANLAYGPASIANGQYSVAIGEGSHASGDNCYAYGQNSYAGGRHSTAVGAYSHADGDNCYTDCTNSYAGGRYALATNDYAYAYGNHVIAGSTNSVVVGRCAIATNAYAYVWNGEDIQEERSPMLTSQAPTEWNTANYYGSHGDGTFNVNPIDGPAGFYIGDDKLSDLINSAGGAATAEYIPQTYTEGNRSIDTTKTVDQYFNFANDTGSGTYTLTFANSSASKVANVKLYLTEWYHTPNNNTRLYDISSDNIVNYPAAKPWTNSPTDAAKSVWEVCFKSVPGSTNWYYVDSTEYVIEAFVPPAEVLTYYFQFEDSASSNDMPESNTYSDGTKNVVNSQTSPVSDYEIVAHRATRGKESSDKFVGTHSLRLAPIQSDSPAYFYNSTAFASKMTKISFQYARYGTDAAANSTFKVYTSEDGTTWTEYVDLTSSTTTSLQTFTGSSADNGFPANAKYVRFEATSTASTNIKRYNIDEIQIWLDN